MRIQKTGMVISKYFVVIAAIFSAAALTSANGWAPNNDNRAAYGGPARLDEANAHAAQKNAATARPTSRDALSGDRYFPIRGDRETKLQIGPWTPAPYNFEEPFINIIHASSVTWKADGYTTEALYKKGYVNPDTGLPAAMPPTVDHLMSHVYFSGKDKRFYDGEWVLEWDGDADLKMQYVSDKLQRRVSPSRLEFTRSTATPDHAAIRINRLGPGGLQGLRLYRAENEAALKSGKIYSPRFIGLISRGHIVRTMDLQEANRAFIRRASQVSPMSEHFWANSLMQAKSFDYPHRSVPLEALFALAMEADVALWHHAPMELGAPKSFYDPTLVREKLSDHAGAVSDMARSNANAILASREWDLYADRFVAALLASGYPADRPLYTTVSNEVWNFARRYHVSTRYAWGIGQGYGAAIGAGKWRYREGYGVILARWAEALDAALQRAGRRQRVIYVVESQAANPATTSNAMKGMKTYVDRRGDGWPALSRRVGVSIAAYWGGRGYFHLYDDIDPKDLARLRARFDVEVRRNPDDLARRLADFYINGPDAVIGTKSWVLAKFADHARRAGFYGVSLIGAYEGGSHDEAPSFFRKTYGENAGPLRAWRKAYLWGPEGARVNTAVNDALAEAYPGLILSNYATVGAVGGQSWFDGMYNENNAMQRSWAKYQRRPADQ